MSKLLVRPNLDGGAVHDITPASAGWSYVGFGLHDLKAGQTLDVEGTADEICLVLLTGDARIRTGDLDTGMLTGRVSEFDRAAPQAVYIPMRT
ncbi:MAG: 5-deoxy-glucuronate isomerase, partial [Rhodobiaceae bacterium]